MTAVWSDNRIRVVSLTNLRAMCRAASGVCHRYKVTVVSSNRVTVTYTYFDGETEHVTFAQLPCWPCAFGGDGNPRVALEPTRICGSASTADTSVFDPVLFCDPMRPPFGQEPNTEWRVDEVKKEEYDLEAEARREFWRRRYEMGGFTTGRMSATHCNKTAEPKEGVR